MYNYSECIDYALVTVSHHQTTIPVPETKKMDVDNTNIVEVTKSSSGEGGGVFNEGGRTWGIINTCSAISRRVKLNYYYRFI